MPPRILIVEDERIMAEDLRDILANLGYTVTSVVSTGREALTEAEEKAPDLALMDICIQGDLDGRRPHGSCENDSRSPSSI